MTLSEPVSIGSPEGVAWRWLGAGIRTLSSAGNISITDGIGDPLFILYIAERGRDAARAPWQAAAVRRHQTARTALMLQLQPLMDHSDDFGRIDAINGMSFGRPDPREKNGICVGTDDHSPLDVFADIHGLNLVYTFLSLFCFRARV